MMLALQIAYAISTFVVLVVAMVILRREADFYLEGDFVIFSLLIAILWPISIPVGVAYKLSEIIDQKL